MSNLLMWVILLTIGMFLFALLGPAFIPILAIVVVVLNL